MRSIRRVDIITTCKGRLHHLQQTLPAMLDTEFGVPHGLIVVCYGDDEALRWLREQKSRQLRIIRVDDDVEYFQPSRARNIGGCTSNADVLCFVDADVTITSRWADLVMGAITHNRHYGAHFPKEASEKYGTCAVLRSAYHEVRGYDEQLRNWGHQDHDFYRRLRRYGSLWGRVDPYSVSVIHNNNAERVAHYEDQRIASYGKPASNDTNATLSADPARTVNPDGYGRFQGRVLVP